MNVIKRDKTIEIFRIEKIFSAVERAFESCKETFPDELKEQLISLFDDTEDITVSVEEIQDEIENTLLCEYPEVAKSYIIYRYNHKVIRENRDKLIKGLTKKLMAQDIENQNANVDEQSFGGRMGEASRIVTKDYALNYCMSRKSRKNHLNNEIYIHKLKIVA
jgi:ribonucleoside-triphosphate reductase